MKVFNFFSWKKKWRKWGSRNQVWRFLGWPGRVPMLSMTFLYLVHLSCPSPWQTLITGAHWFTAGNFHNELLDDLRKAFATNQLLKEAALSWIPWFAPSPIAVKSERRLLQSYNLDRRNTIGNVLTLSLYVGTHWRMAETLVLERWRWWTPTHGDLIPINWVWHWVRKSIIHFYIKKHIRSCKLYIIVKKSMEPWKSGFAESDKNEQMITMWIVIKVKGNYNTIYNL